MTERKEGILSMALPKARLKEILSETGCDGEHISDAVEKILNGHVATVDALKEQIASLEEKVTTFEAEHKELEELKKNSGDISALQKEFDEYKANVEADRTKTKKESAFREILKEAGVSDKRIASIIKCSAEDINGIEFDDEGKVKGSSDILQKVQNDWSDFIESSHVEGVKTPNPPSNTGAKTTMTKEQIRSISDPVARQKAMMDNPSLFGLPEISE